MEGVVKVALVGVLAAILCLALKKDTPALALTVTMAVVSVLFYFLLTAIESVMGFIQEMAGLAALAEGLLLPLIKCVGIAIVTRLAADLCRDAKETAVASAVELTGVVVSLYLTLPLLQAVVGLVRGLI
jgi:stage III sporulation protein AD